MFRQKLMAILRHDSLLADWKRLLDSCRSAYPIEGNSLMSKCITVKDSNGYEATHVFSDSDWNKLRSLCGQGSGEVTLSEGLATLDSDIVFVTRKSPGGSRIWEIPASDLCD